MNAYDQMREGIGQARVTIQAADNVTADMAEMISGRLRKINSWRTLAKLKRELKDFNINTRSWK